jgi:hypothetical protein
MIDVNRYPPPPLAAICPRCSARVDIGANSVEEFAGREVTCVCGCQFSACVFASGPAAQILGRVRVAEGWCPGFATPRTVFVSRYPGFFPPGCFARRHPLIFIAVFAFCIVLQWLLSR